MNIWEEMQRQMERDPDPREWVAMVIAERITSLLKGAPGEVPREVFAELCQLSLEAFKDYKPGRLYDHGILENPSAAPLLHYLLIAFGRYAATIDDIESKPENKTHRSREALADAFRVTGQRGRPANLESTAMRVCDTFSDAFDQARHDRKAHHGETCLQGCQHDDAECTHGNDELAVAVAFALRAAYKAQFGTEYVPTESGASKNMKKIRSILEKEGYLPKTIS